MKRRLFAALIVALVIIAGITALEVARQRARTVPPRAVARPPALPALPAGGVRGLYMSGWAAGTPNLFAKNVGVIDRTELNAMVIDVKDDGRVSYAVDVPLAREVGANRGMIRDIDGILATLAKHDIFPIARIACFRDSVLAAAHPELAVQTAGGKVWRDKTGHAWLNPYDRRCWDYNVALAADAIGHGFKEVQFDYVRFPSEGQVQALRYPRKPAGMTREQCIAAFAQYAHAKVKARGAYLSAAVFGLSSKPNPRHPDMGIGQTPTNVGKGVDVLCPMVYPSHYGPGEYNITDPNRAPYLTVFRSVGDAVKAQRQAPSYKLRPWLQDFSLNGVSYGSAQVKAQITALHDLGIHQYLLWNARCRYTEAALAKQ